MKNFALACLLCFVWLQIYGQTPNDGQFTNKLFYSDFADADKSLWPAKSNQYYFFLIDRSRYVMECKNSEKRAYLLPKNGPVEQNYKVETNLAFDEKSTKNGSAGLAIALKSNLESGFLFEINTDREFRVTQIISAGENKYLSGTEKKAGWQSTKAINKADINNRLTVIKNAGKLKFNINNTTVFTTDEDKLHTGQNGIFINGVVRAFATDFSLYIAGEKNASIQKETSLPDGTSANNTTNEDVNTLSDALMKCRKENEALQSGKENTEAQLKQAKQTQNDLQKFIADNLDIKLQAELEKLKKRTAELETQNESLKTENKDLKAFKQDIQTSAKDADLVILLSENLKKERAKNEELSKKIKQLQTPAPKSKKK